MLQGRHLLAGLVLLAAAAAPAAAGDRDHERARAALERGEVLPLRTILERLGPAVDGEIVEAELDREKRGWVYELKLIDGRGRLVELEVDAATGALLEREVDD